MPQPFAGPDPIVATSTFTLRSTIVFGLGIFVVAIATRFAHLHNAPFYDELYHILAATSRSENGTFAVYHGTYSRAPLYTIFTAWIFDLAGSSDIVLARAPNVLFGALLAAGSAVWTRRVAGPLAGWIVALCVILWPSGIQLSQIVRFYAAHGLVFFVAAIATYDLFRPDAPPLRRLLMAGLALAALWLATQLQDSTLVGALGLAVWAVSFVMLPAVWRHRQRRVILLAFAAAILLAGVALVATGTLQDLWAGYRSTPWERDPTGYHRVLRATYPLLWPITPILAIFALRSAPRPAAFCTVLVIVVLIVHSFAGVQNLRHIYYISPFLFALWAMGIQAVFVPVFGHLWRATAAVFGRAAGGGVTMAVVILAMLFAILSNAGATRAIKLIKGGFAPPVSHNPDWAEAREPIRQYARDGAVIVVTDDLAAIYYLGGFDVAFSKNWLPEMNATEFARDPRTGQPMIQDTDSLADIVQAYPQGVFATPRSWWAEWAKTNDITALLGAFDAPNVDWSIDDAGPVSILHWRSAPRSDSGEYARVRELVGMN